MTLSPTSDETWQWAFAMAKGCTYRCLSRCNRPQPLGKVIKPLFHTNIKKYTQYHNAIAAVLPEYKQALAMRIKENPIKYELKYEEL